MHKSINTAICTAAVTVSIGMSAPPAHANSTPTTAGLATTATPVTSAPLNDALESRLLALVNYHRSRAHLKPLKAAACPDAYAERHARYITSTRRLVHQPLYPILNACGALSAGENVAMVGAGRAAADRLMTSWIASPPHRVNILDPQFTHIGLGQQSSPSGRVFAVQVFLTL